MLLQLVLLVICGFSIQNSNAGCPCSKGKEPEFPSGPGYSSPEAAIQKHKREKIVYVPCITLPADSSRSDYVTVVDVDPQSTEYGKVIHRLNMPASDVKCELHHFGWNTCSSCHHHKGFKRDKLIFPCLNSDAIHIVDTTDERHPTHYKTIQPEKVHALGLSAPHTSHCLPTGEVMISTMGDGPTGNGKGQFLMLDGKNNFTVKGKFSIYDTKYGYDFWYQPCFDVMVSTEWGAPKAFKQGLNLSTLAENYGHNLNIWSWSDRKFQYSVDLGIDVGWLPLETRFLHNPYKPHGYVGTAVSSTIFHINKKAGKWVADLVISIPAINVANWWLGLPQMPAVITDILISMDDRFLYFSNWVQGDIRQYDISTPDKPVLVGQVFVGGSLVGGGRCPLQNYDSSAPVTILDTNVTRPDILCIHDKRVEGGPQMLQLSLDGKRLYVTTSLFSKWDTQFYPQLVLRGSWLLKIDVNTVHGGLTLDKNFGVDYGAEPGGPTLAHEVRYPGGDVTSDIFLPDRNSHEARVCRKFSE